MSTKSVSIPFTLPEVYHGLAEGHGRLHVGAEGLRLEYRVKDAVLGLLKSRVRELFVPYEHIDEFEYREGWFRRRFVIHVATMQLTEDFPGSDEGQIILRFRKLPKEKLRGIASRISLQLSEHRLQQLDSDDSWPESLQ
ncbi:hypothetical protein KQI65_11880 [bacterium]|nr:hypothetical protein [bacterium]